MIAFLDGVLEDKAPMRVVVNVGGVGYEVQVPLSSYERLGAPGSRCRLLIIEHLREDQHSLYGFAGPAERNLFVRLMTVSGIGPKLALTALSSLPAAELSAAIAAGDVKRLSSLSGIGKRLAERLVVELRDKLSAAEGLPAGAAPAAGGAAAADPRVRDTMLALVSLGYKQAEAQQLAAEAAGGAAAATVEELVRKALSR